MTQSSPLVTALVVLALPCIWCLAGLGFSLLGGWFCLARVYAVEGRPSTGDLFRYQRIRFGSVAYKGIVHVGVNVDGLFFSALFPFRVCHPPLFIPGSDRNVALFAESVLMGMGRVEVISMTCRRVRWAQISFDRIVDPELAAAIERQCPDLLRDEA